MGARNQIPSSPKMDQSKDLVSGVGTGGHIEIRTIWNKRCFGDVQRLEGYVVASRGLQGSYGFCEVSG